MPENTLPPSASAAYASAPFVPQLYMLPKMPLHTSPISALFHVLECSPLTQEPARPRQVSSPGTAFQNHCFEAVSHLNVHAQVQAKGELPATLICAFPETSFFPMMGQCSLPAELMSTDGCLGSANPCRCWEEPPLRGPLFSPGCGRNLNFSSKTLLPSRQYS